MKPFITRMGLIEKSKTQTEYESLNARAVMARTAFTQLEKMYKDGLLSNHVWTLLANPIKNHASNLAEAASKMVNRYPDVEVNELKSAIQEALKSERAALRTLLQNGSISEETFSDLVQEVDAALTENQSDLIHMIRTRILPEINDLMTIVIQEKDSEKITQLLAPFGYPITHIASTGGFLGRRNSTLLIGVPPGKASEINQLVMNASKHRAKIVSDDVDVNPKLTHDGATIFTLDVERYEEL